ncbi:hypothetical protein FXO38_15006 [Capsicum annuum]|nr:hypothetical protein FXO38_15006 [Capsicum annuum]
MNVEYCDVASSIQIDVVTGLTRIEMHKSSFCDTLGVVRFYEDQTFVVSSQELVDPLDDKIDSSRKNNLCPSSASTYNLNKVLLPSYKSINTLVDPCENKGETTLVYELPTTRDGMQNDQSGENYFDLLECLENPNCDCTCANGFDCDPFSACGGLNQCVDYSFGREGDIFVGIPSTSSLWVSYVEHINGDELETSEYMQKDTIVEVDLCDTFLYSFCAHDISNSDIEGMPNFEDATLGERSSLKRRGSMCLQCLFLSLCIPTYECIFDENNFLSTFLHYLHAYNDIHNLVESTSYIGMNYPKRRICISLNALISSLCASHTKFLDPNGIVIDNSTLDDAFTFDFFLYYLFAYDDIHDSFGLTLCGGREFVDGKNEFSSLLDVHGIAYALSQTQPDANVNNKILESWQYANKITHHKWAEPFMEPVDVKGLGLDDYYELDEVDMQLEELREMVLQKCSNSPQNDLLHGLLQDIKAKQRYLRVFGGQSSLKEIADFWVNGLSIEQRKRLTIAVELVANLSIIFMDEPTSGLDVRAAAIVMRTVRNTVDTGRTIVCTIHQPSIDIFEAFDEGKSQDLFNTMGSMYAAVIFLGIHNSAAVQSVVVIEHIVFSRESVVRMFSALTYTFGQAERMSRVRHPNLVTLMGIFSESRFLTYEFLENGNLEDHLACHKKSRPLHWQHQIRIVVEICSALIFVHVNDPCIVYGNLRPTNFLLDANSVSKISDFGVHLLISQNENSNYDDPEASIYVDPECVDKGPLTIESDVYSFSVILL